MATQTELVLKAFRGRPRTIEGVMSSLEKSGHKLTEKQVRSALDRARARGVQVTRHDRRKFAVAG